MEFFCHIDPLYQKPSRYLARAFKLYCFRVFNTSVFSFPRFSLTSLFLLFYSSEVWCCLSTQQSNMAATWQLTTMDSQGQSSQNQPTHSMRPGSCNSSTENDILRDPSTEGQGESQAPPAYGKFFDQPRQALQLQQLFSFEAEAKKILCSDNLQLIQPLLRFGLYGDENSLRHNLQHIRTFKLDHILTALLGDTQMIVEKDRKVNKILDLVESDRTPPNVGSDWEPRDTIAMDAEQIASRIELESHLLFKNIRVEHCLKHAIGWMERSIKNLFVQHRCFSFKIRCYLREYPMEREKFIHVEEVGPLGLNAPSQSRANNTRNCETEAHWLIERSGTVCCHLNILRISTLSRFVNHSEPLQKMRLYPSAQYSPDFQYWQSASIACTNRCYLPRGRDL